MNDRDRFRLIFRPYKTPRFRYGLVVMDEVRDCDVIIVGISNARIRWPLGRRRGSGARALVVYGRLADAVRHESNQAVCYWWGVTPQTVTKWRKALGVGPTTDGTSKLRSDYTQEEVFRAALKKAQSKAKDPVRRAKIAAARRRKPRPAHVVEAVRKAHLGMKHSAKSRRKMSKTHRLRGTRPPKAVRLWTPEEDRFVLDLPAPAAAKKTGRTLSAVYSRRGELDVPDGRYRVRPDRKDKLSRG